jgi:hypothetical protein
MEQRGHCSICTPTVEPDKHEKFGILLDSRERSCGIVGWSSKEGLCIGVFSVATKNNEIMERRKVSCLVAGFDAADLLRYEGILHKKRVADGLVCVEGCVFGVCARYTPWPVGYLPEQVLRLPRNSCAS